MKLFKPITFEKTVKTTSFLLMVITVFFFTSCDDLLVPLPDLNPNTSEGSEIEIIEINSIYSFNSETGYNNPQFLDFLDEFDLDGNNITDLKLESVRGTNGGIPFQESTVDLNLYLAGWQILSEPLFRFGSTRSPLFLPPSIMVGASNVVGVWRSGNAGSLMFIEYHFEIPSDWSSGIPFPTGYSYIPIRKHASGNEWYYGWIEIIASDYTDNDTQDEFVISKLGYSTTPGQRIGMGQEE